MNGGDVGYPPAGQPDASSLSSIDDLPFQKGEMVFFGEGKTGEVTRTYVLENKYAVKLLGDKKEVRTATGGFVYFKKQELQRAAPLRATQEISEPPTKQMRLDVEANTSGPMEVDVPSKRLEGRVRWYSKEKGFGKIEPIVKKGQAPAEEVFVHKRQIEGGLDGVHAQAIAEGVLVSYELITLEDRPCATAVQVAGISSLKKTASVSARRDPAHLAFVQQLIQSGMQIGTHQITGHWKASSEDRFLVRVGVPVPSLGDNCKNAVCSLFGVFDGHSGASCSDFVAVHLDKTVFDSIRHRTTRDQSGGREVTSDITVKSALLAAFRTTEHNFFQYANKLEGGAAHAWATAGSTACTAFFYGPDEEGNVRLVTANAGDSRAVLGKFDGRAVRLTEDHTPDVPSERRRIEQEGAAIVNAQGIWRIVLPSRRGSQFAGLSVSRGFGDHEYKQPASVVSAVPDVVLRAADIDEDSFIVIASDGVWGSVDDTEAVRIVSSILSEGGEGATKRAAQVLAETAHHREASDDKTALVVWFGRQPNKPPDVARTSAPKLPHPAVVRQQALHQAVTSGMRVAGEDNMFAMASSRRSGDSLDLFAGACAG